jgi:hypothetical protein
MAVGRFVHPSKVWDFEEAIPVPLHLGHGGNCSLPDNGAASTLMTPVPRQAKHWSVLVFLARICSLLVWLSDGGVFGPRRGTSKLGEEFLPTKNRLVSDSFLVMGSLYTDVQTWRLRDRQGSPRPGWAVRMKLLFGRSLSRYLCPGCNDVSGYENVRSLLWSVPRLDAAPQTASFSQGDLAGPTGHYYLFNSTRALDRPSQTCRIKYAHRHSIALRARACHRPGPRPQGPFRHGTLT